ncbi:hypothetical protein [Staphylococcus succinus]
MLQRKLNIANLNTPIHKLEHLSQTLGKDIYISKGMISLGQKYLEIKYGN